MRFETILGKIAALTFTLTLAVSAQLHGTPAPERAQPTLAITFDDIPAHGPLPAGMTRAGVMRAIVASLKAAHVPAHGFLNASFGVGEPQRDAAIAAWRSAGFPVGNHGYHHRNLDTLTPDQFRNELISDEAAVDAANARQYARWFRFPFLSEGSRAPLRDAARRILAERGYRIAAVTMSFGDFLYAEPYARCMAKGDRTAIAQLEAHWLAAARAEAVEKRRRSLALTGRDVPQVLLMHVGAFDARMMTRTIALYRSLGYRFVTLEEAQHDPFYASANDLSLPGPSPSFESVKAGAAEVNQTVAQPTLTDFCR